MRRSAACSSASLASPARLSAFAIAIATSAVKELRRASVSTGSGLARVVATPMTPHRRPSTMIGTATPDPRPTSLTRSRCSPVASSKVSMRAGRAVSNTSVVVLLPPRGQRLPMGQCFLSTPTLPTMANEPSGS